MLYDWIIANKELVKVIYALIICFICAIVVIKTDRLFKISNYQGLRYFRNAFFFYGVSFLIRFILGGLQIETLFNYEQTIWFLFEFTIITAGFMLLYSLIWKKIENEIKYHSLFNRNMFVIYAISLVITVLDALWNTPLFMYLSQIVLFIALIKLSYSNFAQSGKESPFLKYYFITMILGLAAWLLNMILQYYLNWNKVVQMIVYGLNALFFLLFLYGALNIAKNSKNGKKKRKT
jgi:hypothetical protein